jgi:myo-inositol catabolism protein IolC
MAQAAPEWIAASFTLDDMIAQVAATYDEALAEWRKKAQD